jgi:phosphatidate cytidylyltransferase
MKLFFVETGLGVRVPTLTMALVLPLATYWKGVVGLCAATVAMIFFVLLIHLWLYATRESVVHSLGGMFFAQLYIPFLLSHVLLLFHLPAGRRWIFFLFIVIFAGDTGAYYAGHRWGKHKLWPTVSPGKTIEGAVGGLVSSLAAALLAGGALLSLESSDIIFLFSLGLLLSLAGQLGDLMESMLKRVSHVKDAGGILPGHGGLLDRLDSLIFAFPLTYYAVVFFT